MRRLASLCLVLAACGKPHPGGGVMGDDTMEKQDAAIDTSNGDGGGDGASDDGTSGDGMPDAMTDAMTDASPDAMIDAAPIDMMLDAAPQGPITGGPCSSGTAGKTAYRIRWAGNGAGSTAYPVYEVLGLPSTTRYKAGAYGYQIGFTPRWDDPFLGDGGLVLDGSDFVDIELTTVGLASISNATLSIRGRSFNTTASGSYNWQTFEGSGATPTNYVANSAPYQWYSADMTTEISAGNNGVLLRIKAGPGSGSLIVNRIEICMTAN